MVNGAEKQQTLLFLNPHVHTDKVAYLKKWEDKYEKIIYKMQWKEKNG